MIGNNSTGRRKRLAPALTSIVFLAGGVDAFDNGMSLLGILSILVAVLNVAGAVFAGKHEFRTKIFLTIANSAFAAVSFFIYNGLGRNIAYGWALVFIVSAVSVILTFRKHTDSAQRRSIG